MAVALSSCADTPDLSEPPVDVPTAVQARGLGDDGLDLLNNIVRHRGPADVAVISPAATAYLRDPLAVMEATAGLGEFAVIDAGDGIGSWLPPRELPPSLAAALAAYVNAMVAARNALQAALPRDCCDTDAIAREIVNHETRHPRLNEIVRGIDETALARAIALSVSAHDRLIVALGAVGPSGLSSVTVTTLESPLGPVRIGGIGDDVHVGEWAVLVDVGGDDRIELQPASAGQVRAVIDLAGHDIYAGSDLALFGLSTIIDLAGDDLYRTLDSGQAATVGGVALLHDGAGNDRYEAGIYGQAAAIAGFARLDDRAGIDSYRIESRGQGFGGPLGFAMLRDRAGDDRYLAVNGLVDKRGRRGGRLSYAQGVGRGLRGLLGGGTGVLRDDAGNDTYEAEMFSQGHGYFYGTGVLSDVAGTDSYLATRYAQGQGAHAGVGLLEDLTGDDIYQLTVGVGQGMGLDAAIGILADEAGRDRYAAGDLAQGSTTGNGFGLLIDADGADVYDLAAPGRGWGRGRGSRGLPGLPFLIDAVGENSYLTGGNLLIDPAPSNMGGPLAGRDSELPPEPKPGCPEPGARHDGPARPSVEWLMQSAPGFGDTPAARTAYRHLVDSLPGIAGGLLRELAPGEITLLVNYRRILVCFLDQADEADRQSVRAQLTGFVRTAAPQASFALAVLRKVPPPPDEALSLANRLQSHPDCGTRAGGLRLALDAVEAAGGGTDWNDRLRALARAWIQDPCWQAKAAGLRVLRRLQGRSDAAVPDDLWPSVPQILRRGAVAESDSEDEE